MPLVHEDGRREAASSSDFSRGELTPIHVPRNACAESVAVRSAQDRRELLRATLMQVPTECLVPAPGRGDAGAVQPILPVTDSATYRTERSLDAQAEHSRTPTLQNSSSDLLRTDAVAAEIVAGLVKRVLLSDRASAWRPHRTWSTPVPFFKTGG
jgi:hypothetical protein